MKPLLPLLYTGLGLLAPMALTCASGEPTEATREATPAIYSAEHNALLRALDARLAQFEVLSSKDGNAPHAARVKETLDALKQRRDVINKVAFDQGKYDELGFDLNVAYQRLQLWLAPPPVPKAASKGNPAN